jgi:hypothetical protein
MNIRNAAMLVLGILIGVTMQSALAKGPPQKITISGGDLPGEIEITGDYATMSALSMMSLEDYQTLTPDAPQNISGDGYLITRFYETSSGRYVAFDEVRYYPNPDGGRGYLNYLGIVNGSSEYDGKWFRASAAGEAALQAVIAGNETRETPASTSSILRIFLNAFAAFASH